MKPIILFAVIIVGLLNPSNNFSKPTKYPSIASKHQLLWKTEIGNTTFRTNLFIKDSLLIIGSNGDNYMDYTFSDEKSGVYFLNPRNGKIIHDGSESEWGDFDINGVLVYNNLLYYGNDNEEFICSDLRGNIIWRKVASGDVEHAPALINILGRNVIVYASELGEVRAVDPKTGKKIWSYYAPSFSGWKEGDNTYLFKVKAFLSNSKSFFTSPVLLDINNDRTDDLVYLGYDNIMYAINGQSGKLLWMYEDADATISFIFKEKSGNGSNQVRVMTHNYIDSLGLSEEKTFTLDLNGQNSLVGNTSHITGDIAQSLNALNWDNNSYFISSKDTLFYLQNGIPKNRIYTGEYFFYENKWQNRIDTLSRNSYCQLLGNKIIKYGKHEKCIILLSQYDSAQDDDDCAFLIIIDIVENKVIAKLSLPSTSEMAPIVADVNKDGKNEILINCRDGYLYCYQL
jgi:outer membrane protein assembly factor BamB